MRDNLLLYHGISSLKFVMLYQSPPLSLSLSLSTHTLHTIFELKLFANYSTFSARKVSDLVSDCSPPGSDHNGAQIEPRPAVTRPLEQFKLSSSEPFHQSASFRGEETEAPFFSVKLTQQRSNSELAQSKQIDPN